jgi:peptide-methionine (S)-S-oxide reductase
VEEEIEGQNHMLSDRPLDRSRPGSRSNSGSNLTSYRLWLVAVIFSVLGASLIPLQLTADSTDQDTPPRRHTATFAGGCFWCMVEPFETLDGVREVTSGYIGGETPNPTYKEVTAGKTGHFEAVQIIFDPDTVTYQELLDLFWRNIDPTDDTGQFCDKGPQYRSAIFAHSAEQKELARTSKEQIGELLEQTVKTEVLDASVFYPAEAYHQRYYKRNPKRYRYYRWRCGRDSRLRELWG